MKRATSLLVILAIASAAAPQLWAQKALKRERLAPTAVISAPTQSKLARIGAFTDGTSVYVKWEMEVERGNVGFYVYRVDASGESLLSPDLIPGAALTVGPVAHYGQVYDYFAPSADPQAAYFVEFVSESGQRARSETFVPAYVSNLKAISGTSVEKAAARAAASTGKDLSGANLTLPKTLAKEVESLRTENEPSTHRWVVSRAGVKIGVRAEGFYRVTRAELQAAGFDVNIDPSLWQLYLNGTQQAMTVGGTGDYIEFLGRGIDTVESDIAMYYLTAGDTAGKRIAERVARPGGVTVNSPTYSEVFVKKERTNYLNQVLNGDAENYFGRVIGSTATTFPFTLTGVYAGSETATVNISLHGYNFDQHVVELILNGHPLESATGQGRTPFSRSYVVPTSWLVEGANALQMRSIGPSGDLNLFDNISVSFARTFLAQQNTLKFYTQNYKTATLDGFTSADVDVYDITAIDEPVLMTNLEVLQRGATFGPTMPSARGRVFYAVENGAYKTPFSIEQNDPGMLGVPTHAADLVIISHKSLVNESETWANYRRGQGFSVKVVNVDEIYDEYNYGVLSSASVNAFLNYAKNNWQTAPRYVLLMGDASFDSRNYQGTGYFNMVPTKWVTTIFSETSSDEALADFDGDGLAEMAVGRIAVRTPQSVTDIFNRVVSWEANLVDPLSRGAVFANDGNNGYDFAAMSQRLRQELPPEMPVTMISRDSATAQADLIAAINTGKYLVNYVGHGTTGAWAATSFFSVLNVPQLTNANSRSIFTMLTCLNGFFANLTSDSFAESLVKANNGGAIAAWASAGLTTPDVQELMAARFFGKVAAGDIARLGDLIRDAKTSIPGGSDVRLSWALIGDPMLKVR